MSAPTSTAHTPIRLHLLPDTPNTAGEPRAALEVPPEPNAISRRPVLRLFVSLGAALEAKRQIEGGIHARP